MKRQIILALFLGAFFGAYAQSAGAFFHRAYAQVVSWISLSGSVTGTTTNYSCAPTYSNCYAVNQIHVLGDTLNAGTTGPGGATHASGPYALDVIHQFGGAAQVGWAGGISVSTLLTAQTGNASADYVGISNIIGAEAPDSASAAIFAGNNYAQLRAGATGYLAMIDEENDIAALTGSSVQDKMGVSIVQTSSDAVVGSRSNIAFTIGNQGGVMTGWDCGICFGNYSGNWPMTSTSTIIGGWPHATARSGSGASVPVGNAGTALYGVDFTNVTFASGGSPFLAPLATPSSSSDTCKQGAIEWDASFIYICTASSTWKRATLATF